MTTTDPIEVAEAEVAPAIAGPSSGRSAARVAFATLGCRLNQVDTEEMQAGLAVRGLSPVRGDERADVVVVNSCTVTARADFSDRQAIRRAARRHPGARIVVTGCWAQVDPGAAVAAGADLVLGNADKPRLAEAILTLLTPGRATADAPRIQVSDVSAAASLPPAPPGRRPLRSRAFLKIQDGCQHRCAFCVVPLARGNSRSRPLAWVVAEAERLVAAGHPELVLTGIDLGHYGADLTPRVTLAALLRTLVDLPGLRWLRLSSLLPAYCTPELLDVLEHSPRIAPHLHIPLQSGSARVLRLMRRPYTVRMYRTLVERLARAMPRLGLGTDLIAGFPGETDDDFEATRALVEALPFSYLHVFPYSDRPGTEGSRRPGRLDARTIARRSAALRALSAAKAAAFRRALVGSTEEALVLDSRDRATGHLIGLTGPYVEVTFPGPDALMRQMVTIRITGADEAGAQGVLA